MGDEQRTNKALSIPLLKALLRSIEENIRHAEEPGDKHAWIIVSCYVAVCYVISLRGNEAFLLDLGGLQRHWQFKNEESFIIALRGKIKGEKHDLEHLIPCINTTSTGIPVKAIVKRLMKFQKLRNRVKGPALTDYSGKTMSASQVDQFLLECLSEIYSNDKSLFPIDIQRKLNGKEHESQSILKLHYSCFRTFRRTSNTRAKEVQDRLKDDDIDIVNRWRAKESAKGKRPTNKMRQHYAEIEVLPRPFLRYTKAM